MEKALKAVIQSLDDHSRELSLSEYIDLLETLQTKSKLVWMQRNMTWKRRTTRNEMNKRRIHIHAFEKERRRKP